MSVFICSNPPNSLLSKKVFTHRRAVSPIGMNRQII